MPISTLQSGSFPSNVAIDTDTLVVDGVNNRVGVGTASPAQPLHVVGGAVQFQNTQSTYLQVNTSDTHFYTAGAHPLRFGSNSAEVVRVETGGLTFTPATNNLYTVSGTLSYYGTTNNVYLNGASSGGMIMSGNGNRYQYVYLNSVSDSVNITTNTLERLGIDSSGRVTLPYQPSFMAYGGFSYQASTYIWQGFGTVDHNIGGHWNNSIGRFTAPVAGKYMIYATVHHSSPGNYHLWAFLKNGSLGSGNWVQSYTHSSGSDTTSKQQVWNLAAGDWLEVASNATYPNAYLGGYVAVGAYLIG